MGKAAMCIQMLQILNSGRIYKVSELADMLETNPRNIIEYKKELEEIGYYVVSVPGKFGGYRLDTTGVIPSLKLSQEEKTALTEGAGYLQARKDFLLKKDFQKAMAKIYSSIKNPAPQPEPLVISRFPLAMKEEDLESRYAVVKECIGKTLVLKITYINLQNEELIREVEPYDVFMYNNAWYFVGFDRTDNDIRYYKLNRIREFCKTNIKFHKRLSYSESDFLDEFGMKQNGEQFAVQLKISGAYAVLAQERIYGKNQKIEKQPDGTIILSCEMQNQERILSTVLSMGEHCEVLAPENIRNKVAETIAKMAKNSATKSGVIKK